MSPTIVSYSDSVPKRTDITGSPNQKIYHLQDTKYID